MIEPMMCLAIAVYFEARSEPLAGQYAVAEVIMNRVEHNRFPDGVCAVVKQDKGPKPMDCQFTFYCDGKPEAIHEPDAWTDAQMIAFQVMQDNYVRILPEDTLWYHTTGVNPKWSRKLEVAEQIGIHKFFVRPS